MAEKKVTIMVLKVDLQCEKCYKKVKKVLCKFPQIRDQKYDEKANTVTITVVCCSPEKIRDKICRKGCGVIQNIEILPPPKPPPPPPPPAPPAPPPPDEKPEDPLIAPRPPRPRPPPQPPQPPPPPPPAAPAPPPPPEQKPQDPLTAPPRPPPPPPPPPAPQPPAPEEPKRPPATGYPSIFPMVGICLVPYCKGYGGGRGCHHGHERPTPCYDGCGCGRDGSRWQSSSGPGYSDGCRCGCGSGGGRGQSSSGFCYSDGCGCGCGGKEGYATRSDQYYYEENPQTCRIM